MGEKSKIEYKDVKIIANGHIIETYEYEKPVCVGHDGNNGGRTKEESKRWEENRRLTGRRARDNVKRLAIRNFTEYDKFLSLTFSDGLVRHDVKNVKESNYEFKKYIQRLRYWLKKQGRKDYNFKYIAVVEFQDENGRGAVHYHMIADFDYIPHEVLLKIWKMGSVNVQRMDKLSDGKTVDNVGAYLIKYLIKDTGDDRLRGERAILTSRGLLKPTELRGNKGYKDFVLNDALKVKEKNKVFTNSYESEHNGIVRYTEYNLKR